MENASKALLIAGSILIGMIVISLFYYMFDKVGMLVSDTDRNTLEQEIADVNKGFEAYNKKIMYGIDVINVLNKAIDNNKRNDCEFDENSEFNVNITLNITDNQTIPELNIKTYTLSNDYAELTSLIANANNPDSNFKRRTFRCTKVEYHDSGRVKNMNFTQI